MDPGSAMRQIKICRPDEEGTLFGVDVPLVSFYAARCAIDS
jgi:hypothetical protein